jgi:hypothetical protein
MERSMRGAWRSARLVVAAALGLEEAREGVGQQQQHDEELQGHVLPLCVAGASLDNVEIRNGCRSLLPRQ